MAASPEYRSRPRSASLLRRSSQAESRSALVTPLDEARFVATLLREAGASTTHARLVASAFAAADVRGKFNFGLLTLPHLLEAVNRGELDLRASPMLVNDAPTLAWVDGGEALGPVVGHFCMNLALFKAKMLGLGIIFCRSVSDMGFAGWYTSMALKKNMIGLCFSSLHDNPVTVVGVAAGNPQLAINRMAASAPCKTSNNFEMEMSWRLSLPPQTLKPRLPSDLRRATSSDLKLHLEPRPPPGACGHDPRKGFLAALVVEGLCGFIGGLHYESHHDSDSSPPEFDASNLPDYQRHMPKMRESLMSKDSTPRNYSTASDDSRSTRSNVETNDPRDSTNPMSHAGIPHSTRKTEVICSQPPPPNLGSVVQCACLETPGAPKENATAVCVRATEKHSASRKRVTLDTEAAITPGKSLPAASSFKNAPSASSEEDKKPTVESKTKEDNKPQEKKSKAAHCFIAINPDAIQPGFSERLGIFLRNMTAQEPMDPARPVLVPGDPERMAILRAQRQGGVRFLCSDVERINILAHRMGVTPLEYSPDVEFAWWRN